LRQVLRERGGTLVIAVQEPAIRNLIIAHGFGGGGVQPDHVEGRYSAAGQRYGMLEGRSGGGNSVCFSDCIEHVRTERAAAGARHGHIDLACHAHLTCFQRAGKGGEQHIHREDNRYAEHDGQRGEDRAQLASGQVAGRNCKISIHLETPIT
jgi:hypothetical protein